MVTCSKYDVFLNVMTYFLSIYCPVNLLSPSDVRFLEIK